ncbi:glycosyl transferase [Kovacikia minuta CCNUW1]|uniref:glycosyl transferase n=1 Tax=Kovacikia minuta TaxID=2931930 RepID=UPI001CCC2423|nr:glycosyl transferase [Kovacikia minuta]UBF27338.1 glycosyl transferase [Kovacikia minuta CCNUW1]
MYSSSFSSNLQQLLKSLKLGAIAYRLYYAPRNAARSSLRKGLWNTVVDAQAQRRMEQAAYQLPTIPSDTSLPALEVHFLTGKKFWYQTCFCAVSLAQQTELPIRPVIYDDGSLQKCYQEAIQRIFPNVKIFLKPELDVLIEEYLPQHRFPYLRDRRQYYPNIRKLTDVHLGNHGWKLVLDSDMLFFRPPTLLLNWLQAPQAPCYMVDTETSYGYPKPLMEALVQTEIPDRVNVGICGLNSDEIDWEQLEFWCKTMIEQQGTHYYQEQALIAMLMAGKPCVIAPVENYIVMPNQEETIHPQAILHHYVADSKPWYFRYGWRHIQKGDRIQA